jgi:AcrR family transcriptional regulator
MPRANIKTEPVRRNNQYEKRLSDILKAAAKVMARDGYEGASVRDVAARGRIGLSGIYYYFKSKDELLFAIQHHTFSTLVRSLKKMLSEIESPRERLKAVFDNHFRFFVNNMDDLKVCVHEIESLSGKYYREIHKIRKEYYRLVRTVVAENHNGAKYDIDLAALSLFGSLNWVYMWFDSEMNSDIEKLSDKFCENYINGIKSP